MRANGAWLAIGLAVGAALWVATDQVVWLAVGVAIGAALGFQSGRTKR
jgi:hypothetical protein